MIDLYSQYVVFGCQIIMYKSEEFIIDLDLQANMTRNRNGNLRGRLPGLDYWFMQSTSFYWSMILALLYEDQVPDAQ